MNKKREIILHTAIIFSFVLVFLRLTDLMIINHKRLAERAKQQHIKVENVQARRGIIFDRQGRELALNLELESLYGDPENLSLTNTDIKKLALAVKKEPQAILSRIPEEGRFAWIERKLGSEAAEKIRALDIKGLGFLPEAKRFYPKGDLASHILGFVGVDNQALEGIELKYDQHLKTAGGKIFLGRDASGRTLSSGVNTEAKGNNVVLTIDEVIQHIAERELERAMAKWRAAAASVIVMDPFHRRNPRPCEQAVLRPQQAGERVKFRAEKQGDHRLLRARLNIQDRHRGWLTGGKDRQAELAL